MSEERSREFQPVIALRRAVLDSAVTVLRTRAALRLFVGIAGAALFVTGVLVAPLWNVPLLSWLSGGQVAATCLAGGLYALGVWHLSGSVSATSNRQVEGSTNPAQPDLIAQLNQLRDLHTAGALTDDEFSRAKARVLQ